MNKVSGDAETTQGSDDEGSNWSPASESSNDTSDLEEVEPEAIIESDSEHVLAEKLRGLDSINRLQQVLTNHFIRVEFCDFLSDFGRSEPFLIDGDALVNYALSNPYLDWTNGGQYLHLTYIIEKILRNLEQRGAQYEIFFLSGNEQFFCKLGASYVLARSVIVHHFHNHSRIVSDATKSKVNFISESWLSMNNHDNGVNEGWSSLLTRVRPAFIMTNNTCQDELMSAAQHFFVLSQLVQDIHVVVLDQLTFDGSRVRGFLHSPPSPGNKTFINCRLQKVLVAISMVTEIKANCDPPVNESLPPEFLYESCGDARSWLFLCSLRRMFSSSDDQFFMSMLAVSCAFLETMRQLPFSGRGLMVPKNLMDMDMFQFSGELSHFAQSVKDFIGNFQLEIVQSMRGEFARCRIWDVTITDIFDGRLFHLLLFQIVGGIALPESIHERASHHFKMISQLEGLSYSDCTASLRRRQDVSEAASQFLKLTASRASSAPKIENASLVSIGGKESLLAGVLGDVQERMSEHESEKIGESSLGSYFEHHYHNTKPLRDEPDAFTYTIWQSENASLQKMRISAYWRKRKQSKKLKERQLKARADLRYQESLLVGTPVTRQIIARILTSEEMENARKTAKQKLAADRTDAASFDPPEEGVRSLKAGQRAAKVSKLSKKEQIIESNKQRQHDETLKKEAVNLDNFLKGSRSDGPEKLMSSLEKYASDKCATQELALKARMCGLDAAAKLSNVEARVESCFVAAQKILRLHEDVLLEEHVHRISAILVEMGFNDIAENLMGSASIKGAKVEKASKRSSALPQRSSIIYQLKYAADHLARPKGIAHDARVQFPPDKWQQKLLDIVDSGDSALVVAPTASGKTFISYYVMEQCLRAGDDHVVVYVAPTKALVNQVRAEIEARFEKTYRGARSLTSAFTRDFRDDNIQNSQILVTVPACLGILLLSASNVQWASRIRHVIFDEVHCLGEANGEVWEQLLLLVDAPYLALSATLGNVSCFHAWLNKVEETRGRRVHLVEHKERFNYLYQHVYTPSGIEKLTALHPCWVLAKLKMSSAITEAEFPKDLKFLPENCISLFEAMRPFMAEQNLNDVEPERFFRSRMPCEKGRWCRALWDLSMRDVTAWELRLREEFCKLKAEDQIEILSTLSRDTETAFQQVDTELIIGEQKYLEKHIPGLIDTLKKCDMLPAICFRISRFGCERLAKVLYDDLHVKQRAWREKGSWQAKRDDLLNEIEQAQKLLEKCKASIIILDTGEEIDPRADILGRLTQLKFRWNQHHQTEKEFSITQVSETDIEEAFGSLPDGNHWTDYMSPTLAHALLRGIGVHHSGLPLKFRQCVEKLFRQKKLGVIFATSTLAMGINMPSKTSVFTGDAVYLNAMNFRQMAGRAGRRGFDLRGNVVFCGMGSPKCHRLLRSELPMLQGNLVLSNSMVLRLIMRQSAMREHNPKDSEAQLKGIQSSKRLINFPLFNPLDHELLMGKQMAHCFRFSVEYLIRGNLLRLNDKEQLEPNDLAAFVAHLFFMEPSNFAFLNLLLAEDGELLRTLCRPHPGREENVLAVLCHIFCRLRLPSGLADSARNCHSESGPSKVLLESLDKVGEPIENRNGETISAGRWVRNTLQRHNQDASKALLNYLACFVSSYGEELGEDNVLPYTRTTVISTNANQDVADFFAAFNVRPCVKSAFVALSGHGDEFHSIEELCSTLRGGLYCDPKMVPIFDLYEEDVPLNSYLLDFYKHGQFSALIRYNKIGRDGLWDQLMSFALVLKALSAAMERRALQAEKTGQPTQFNDQNVLTTFKTLSEKFSYLMNQNAA